uniref:Uncharacterized protein n=1 Tax=Oryza brachyantha TaxID=4533 RepID=J3MV10_ORYBR
MVATNLPNGFVMHNNTNKMQGTLQHGGSVVVPCLRIQNLKENFPYPPDRFFCEKNRAFTIEKNIHYRRQCTIYTVLMFKRENVLE